MRKAVCVSLLMIMLAFSGCSNMKISYDVYERLYQAYNSMVSYEAEVEVTSFSNHSKNVYVAKQYFKDPDKMRSDVLSPQTVEGVQTVINGDRAQILQPGSGGNLTLSELKNGDSNFLFLNTFFSLYYKSENTSVGVNNTAEGGMIVLETETGLSNPYRSNMRLKVSSKTLNPVQMDILGKDGEVYMTVIYKSFTPNQSIDDSLFEIKE